MGDRVFKYQAGKVSIYTEPARYQNGNALDLEGRIVACSHRDRAIVRQEHSGQWRTLVNPNLLHHILAYPLTNGRITNGRTAKADSVFAVIDPGELDGFCLDAQGNIVTSAKDGTQIYSPKGSLSGKIKVPEVCANVTFGGKHCDQLFITAGKSLCRIQTKVPPGKGGSAR
ncbi:MAG: SMP-30/gluconolactonase/LRE family protein [Phormidesmis sp.]